MTIAPGCQEVEQGEERKEYKEEEEVGENHVSIDNEEERARTKERNEGREGNHYAIGGMRLPLQNGREAVGQIIAVAPSAFDVGVCAVGGEAAAGALARRAHATLFVLSHHGETEPIAALGDGFGHGKQPHIGDGGRLHGGEQYDLRAGEGCA